MWSPPYGAPFSERDDWQGGEVARESLTQRLEMFAHQRRADLSGTEPGFLARYRSK